MKTVVVVQARVGSSRLPGKMISGLGGHSILEWVLLRARRAKEVSHTVLALPKSSENDVLEGVARKIGIEVFRGSEDDVLGRLTLAVADYNPEAVVRICGDRPLVDPDILDDTVRLFHKRVSEDIPLDIAYSHKSGSGEDWPFGFGVEVLSFARLSWLNETVSNCFEREHVTLHIWNNRSGFYIEPLECPMVYSYLGASYKLDLDTVEDLQRLRRLVLSEKDIELPGYVFILREMMQSLRTHRLANN